MQIKKLVWLNPVVIASYDSLELEKALDEKGFIPVQCSGDQIRVVKEKYRAAIAMANKPIADRRCPLALQYITDNYDHDFAVPDIHPVLIHCALELHERFCPRNNTLYITTPCKSLAELGNNLGFENTVFVTWNNFLIENGITLTRKSLGVSPIPPGFFSDLNVKVIKLTSKREIDAFFSSELKANCDMYELLYCEQGCHNGDGILEDYE